MDDSIKSIILSVGVYEGLFVWLWAICCLYLYWRGGGKVSTFILFLLLSDLIDVSISPLVFQKILGGPLAGGEPDDAWGLSALFFGTRIHALYLHQLVALECVLYLRYCRCSGRFFSPFNSVFVCVSVWAIVAFLSHLCSADVSLYVSFGVSVALCSVPLVMAIVTCVLTFTDHPIIPQASSPGQRRQAATQVTAVSMVTLVVVYLPYLAVMCLVHYPSHAHRDGHPFYRLPEPAWLHTSGLVGLRVMADPLLCVLVCSKVKGQRPASTERDRTVELQADSGSD